MKHRFFVLFLAIALFTGCSSDVSLDFRPDEEGVWRVPAAQMDAWARAVVRADDQRARQLLDLGYRQADSLSAGDAQARTLEAFAQEVAERFLNVQSPLYDEHAYDLALEREDRCVNWTSWGRRGMDWRRSVLNLNRAGTRVCDFWLSKGEADAPDTLLRQLLPGAPLTVLFLYGEDCPSCEKLIGEIGASRSFSRMAEKKKVQFISLYTGEKPGEYRALSSRLPSYWDNWYDRENVVKYDRAFDNRMIPSLYVIDEKEIVQLRGARSVREIEKYLH